MLHDLQTNKVSMPAGEALGAVVLLDAVLKRAGDVRYVYCFTDSDATARALTAAGSGAPQINWMMQWLMRHHRGVQFLGIHQRGVRNVTSDNLSRGRVEVVLNEVRTSGATIEKLTPSTSFHAIMNAVRRMPLRRGRDTDACLTVVRSSRRATAEAKLRGGGEGARGVCAQVEGTVGVGAESICTVRRSVP